MAAFRDVQSNLLKDIIDQVIVGHKCSKAKNLEIFNVGQLKHHVESGECPGYSLKCFCGSLDRFSLDELRQHLKEQCDMVRL